jgi:hypothetical protein
VKPNAPSIFRHVEARAVGSSRHRECNRADHAAAPFASARGDVARTGPCKTSRGTGTRRYNRNWRGMSKWETPFRKCRSPLSPNSQDMQSHNSHSRRMGSQRRAPSQSPVRPLSPIRHIPSGRSPSRAAHIPNGGPIRHIPNDGPIRRHIQCGGPIRRPNHNGPMPKQG